MPPKNTKSRRQQTITYNLSNANARDAFEEELELEDAEQQHIHTSGRANRTGRGNATFSLVSDMPNPLYQRDFSGLREFSSPQATADMINLLELFGSSLDREVIESVYLGCSSKFDLAMERLLELAANCVGDEAGCSGSADAAGQDVFNAEATKTSALTDTEATCSDVCYWELLPDDVKRHVLGFLNSRDLARVARTCADFAGPARSVRTNTRQLQVPTGLGMHGIMAMVAGHPNARAVSLRQWAHSPLGETDFTALVVALSSGSRSERRAGPVEALSFKGCRWLSDGNVMAVCHTMQHLKEVDLTDCVGITDAALVALSKYQRLAPKGNSSSSSDSEYDDAPGPTTATFPAVAAAAAAAILPTAMDPHLSSDSQRSGTQGVRQQYSSSGGDGGADGDLQFELDIATAPFRRQPDSQTAGVGPEPEGVDPVCEGVAPVPEGGGVALTGMEVDGSDGEEGSIADDGGGVDPDSRSSSSDEEEDVDGGAGAGAVQMTISVGPHGDHHEMAVASVDVNSSSPFKALETVFGSNLTLAPLAKVDGAVAGTSPAGSSSGTCIGIGTGQLRHGARVTSSASETPLYGTSPASTGGLLGTSYGAVRGRVGSPVLYGTNLGGSAAVAMGSGTKSWLYGSSPVMGASPFFRTGDSSTLAHNGWLARAASSATHEHSGRGLMSLNLSGCPSISSEGVKALLSRPLPKACLLQLDISRCPRITRSALVLPATSNLCVLRASACHNLHEVIMQLPLSSPLTELHLADCKALTKLHVVAPALQQLHVGSCRHLIQLDLRCPQLRHLTASLCFRLVHLEPERWELGRLEHLNLFGCRHLEWPGLAALLARCGSTLRHLDINGCNALVVANIPAGNDGLRHVDASGCKSLVALHCPSPALVALALRACPRLQEVTLDSGALMRLDISNCPHLQRLNMPLLHQQQDQQPARQQQHGALAPAGPSSGQVGALRTEVRGASAADLAIGSGGSGSGRRGETGVMVRMAGCDRLPVEVAVMLRRLRERAKQAAAAAAVAAITVSSTTAAGSTPGRVAVA